MSMSLAAFKDLCIDAHDAALVSRFWADRDGNEFCAFVRAAT